LTATFGSFNPYVGPKRPKMRRKILVATLAASLLLVAAPAAAQDVSVNAEPQATSGDNVTIDSVEMDDDGWVAVYSESVDEGPNFDDLKGAAEVEDGEQDDIVVETDGLDENGFYYAVLHYEEEDSGEFNYPGDSEVTYNDSTVQDDFYVAVGTQAGLQGYAEANQQRRNLQEQIDDLEDQRDELERRLDRMNGTDENLEDQLENVRDELDITQEDLEDIDATIAETEDLLGQLSNASDDGTGSDGGDADGNTSDGDDGNASDDGSDEPQGLPGFTAVAALFAALTAGALLARRD
jgi:PGF-CTERM protein